MKGLGQGSGREGRELTADLLPQNVTLAMAVFTILASIYFFNKVRGKRGGRALSLLSLFTWPWSFYCPELPRVSICTSISALGSAVRRHGAPVHQLGPRLLCHCAGL